jgi:hypothetical protein
VNIRALSTPTLTPPAAAPAAAQATKVTSPFEASLPADSTASVEAPPADPRSLMVDARAAAEPSKHEHSLVRSLMLGLLAIGSLTGLAGCASNADESAYTLAQNMTGKMAQEGYSSISSLNQHATKHGGGLYASEDATAESKLTSVKALDRMLDHKPIYFQDAAGHTTTAVRSWDELRGLAENVKEGNYIAHPAASAQTASDFGNSSGG